MKLWRACWLMSALVLGAILLHRWYVRTHLDAAIIVCERSVQCRV